MTIKMSTTYDTILGEKRREKILKPGFSKEVIVSSFTIDQSAHTDSRGKLIVKDEDTILIEWRNRHGDIEYTTEYTKEKINRFNNSSNSYDALELWPSMEETGCISLIIDIIKPIRQRN